MITPRRLRLPSAPERQVELRIIRAGDPHIGSGSFVVRKIAPRIAAIRAPAGYRDELPESLPRVGVITGNETMIARIQLVASGQTDE